MFAKRTNKRIWTTLVVLCLVASSKVFAEPVSVEEVRKAASTFLQAQEYGQQAVVRSFAKDKIAPSKFD
jgi:TRAP-type C4-dicarboxylate transport system permease large subunit